MWFVWCQFINFCMHNVDIIWLDTSESIWKFTDVRVWLDVLFSKKLTLQMLNDVGLSFFLSPLFLSRPAYTSPSFKYLHSTKGILLPINIGAYFVHVTLTSKHTSNISKYLWGRLVVFQVVRIRSTFINNRAASVSLVVHQCPLSCPSSLATPSDSCEHLWEAGNEGRLCNNLSTGEVLSVFVSATAVDVGAHMHPYWQGRSTYLCKRSHTAQHQFPFTL